MHKTHLKTGDKAPAFSGLDQQGDTITLGDFSGRKLIVFFYPKDNTPGCTAEACSLRDHYTELQEQGFELVGVSADSARKHQNFIKKFKLPFPLIADIDRKVIEAFGVWGKKKFMGREYDGILRTTFIIDEHGVITDIIEKVKTKNHAAQILELST